MKTVTVNTSKRYDVIIGMGILPVLGEKVADCCHPETAAVISDSNVWPIYGNIICDSLTRAGMRVVSFVFPAGEASKNGQTYLNLLNFLAENKLTRSDVVIALGGGVVGDLAGFAASTYLRGIAYIQVPTSLLAMVDSSVGGKTAIDLPSGKNLAGAFCQPALVICDTVVLQTLPRDIFRDGCAEIIKYSVLYDPMLFSHLAQNGLNFDLESVIWRCIALKAEVVSQDEYDNGARQMLNLGHTVGHSIEQRSQYSVSHGQAVAMGMSIVAKACVADSLCDETVYIQICDVLKTFGLPYQTNYTAEQLLEATLSDKKRFGSTIKLIVPRAIGRCEILPIPVPQLKSFIEAGI